MDNGRRGKLRRMWKVLEESSVWVTRKDRVASQGAEEFLIAREPLRDKRKEKKKERRKLLKTARAMGS